MRERARGARRSAQAPPVVDRPASPAYDESGPALRCSSTLSRPGHRWLLPAGCDASASGRADAVEDEAAGARPGGQTPPTVLHRAYFWTRASSDNLREVREVLRARQPRRAHALLERVADGAALGQFGGGLASERRLQGRLQG